MEFHSNDIKILINTLCDEIFDDYDLLSYKKFFHWKCTSGLIVVFIIL